MAKEVPISEIKAEPNRRVEDVSSLARSIEELGLLQPIILSPGKELIAGYRRLEAFRILGRSEIPAEIFEPNGFDRELARIDENLERSELTVLERSEQFQRRKEIYEARYPDTRHGYGPGRGKKSRNNSDSFTKDAAQKAGVSRSTVEQEVRIARRVSPEVKEAIRNTPLEDSKTDLLELTKLEPERQREAVEAVLNGDAKNVRQAEVKARKRRNGRATGISVADLSGEARFAASLESLKGEKFSCIYADPPWQYSNQATRASTSNHYPTMTVEQIASLPVGELAAENAHLHLWVTNAFLFEAPKIFEAWGFEYKSAFVWVKPQIGMGNYWRCAHEYLLLGVRGSLRAQDRSLPSWLEAPRSQHSKKPEAIRELIERLSPAPYLELFARRKVRGWTVFGDQLEAQEPLL